MNTITRSILTSALALMLPLAPALSARNNVSRGGARTSVNRNNNMNRNTNINRNTNVNRNTNINVNRDVDVHVHGGYGGGYYGGGCCYHPVATAAAVTATAMVTAAVIGSVVHTLPPACNVVVVNGISYQNCGGTWYQPQFVGTTPTYVVVAPLR